MVHRDIKPTNLFHTSAGTVKVLDLGLGAFVGVSHHAVTVLDTDEGFAVGTTDYMSPEQLSGQPVDSRTDLFSLGCTMYRLLAGSYAFPGMTKMDRLVRRMHEPHLPINEVRPNLPAPLVSVLDRMLALRPDDRISSAVEVAESLELMIPGLRGHQRGESAGRTVKPPLLPASSPAQPECRSTGRESNLPSSRSENAPRNPQHPSPATASSCLGHPRPACNLTARCSRRKAMKPVGAFSANTASR